VDNLLKQGELEMVKTRGGYNIFHNGISYVYGALPTGEPVYVIEVGSHYSSNQTQLELQRGVIYMQEWLSLLMPPPVETKVVIFNLKSFGIRNMDWWCVFFMVKTIERFYPETLKKVYVHCPPWIFKPIWFILRPLLDPVVREKVSLTSSTQDLGDLIPEDHLPRAALGGAAEWEYEWPRE
jgi:CRAL/TRIO domain